MTPDPQAVAGATPPFPEIWDALIRRRVVLFLGAGASIASRPDDYRWTIENPIWPPSGAELSRHLSAQVYPNGETDTDLARAAQYYEVRRARAGLRDTLRSVFSRRFPQGPLHDLIATVPAKLLVITTNYDTLIEDVFEARGRTFDLLVQPFDGSPLSPGGNGLDPLAHPAVLYHRQAGEPDLRPVFANGIEALHIDVESRDVVYKLHGTVDMRESARDDYCVTENDYAVALQRLGSSVALPMFLKAALAQRRFLFLGYSLRDWTYRLMWHQVYNDRDCYRSRAFQSWSIQRSVSPIERDLWLKRDVLIFDMPMSEFVAGMEAGRPPHDPLP